MTGIVSARSCAVSGRSRWRRCAPRAIGRSSCSRTGLGPVRPVGDRGPGHLLRAVGSPHAVHHPTLRPGLRHSGGRSGGGPGGARPRPGKPAVEKGEVLFEIDPRPFEYRVALLEAKQVDVIQQVAQLDSELSPPGPMMLGWPPRRPTPGGLRAGERDIQAEGHHGPGSIWMPSEVQRGPGSPAAGLAPDQAGPSSAAPAPSIAWWVGATCRRCRAAWAALYFWTDPDFPVVWPLLVYLFLLLVDRPGVVSSAASRASCPAADSLAVSCRLLDESTCFASRRATRYSKGSGRSRRDLSFSTACFSRT